MDVYKKIFEKEGISGLYRGFGLSCMGAMVYRGFYFGFYDSVKPYLSPNFKKIDIFAKLVLALVATSGAHLASFPLETIRRRKIMMHHMKEIPSTVDLVKIIIEKEGINSLFRGASFDFSRSLSGALTLVFYNQLQIVFRKIYEWIEAW